MEFNNSNAKKGADSIPETGALLGTMERGPLSKNLLIPKADETKLRQKVMRGRACEKVVK